MTLPFRNNPKITTNWVHANTKNFLENKTKKAYYEISASKVPGKLIVQFREEKKRLGGSAERAEFWFGHLGFELDSTFARDLKMFLNEYVEGENDEVQNTVRIFRDKGKWCAKMGSGAEGHGETVDMALVDLSANISNHITDKKEET
jgi:hypothetical protein